MLGRPTKYDPSFVEKVYEYLQTVGREQTKLPKRVDIAILLNVDEDTLNNWAKVHSDFFGALTRVDMLQKGQLMDDGMYGGKEVNPQIAKFLLSANHGLKERSDVTTNDKELPTPILGGATSYVSKDNSNE